MPYYITDKAAGCSGWATIKEDGEVIGCHKTKRDAIDQMVAVSIAEDMTPGGERAMPDELKVGDYVSWNSSGGRARGEIQEIIRSGRVRVPGTDFVLQATEDDPVALIQIYRPVEGGWEDTDTIVGHKFSTLRRIDELPEPEDEPESEDMDDEEDEDDDVEERELPDNYRQATTADVPANNNCGNCDHFKNFYCRKWDAFVSPAYYCNAWMRVDGLPNDNPGQTVETGDINDEEPYYQMAFMEEFDREVSLDLPQYIRSAARKGLDYYGKGMGGDGLVARTIREAREMASGRISEDKVIRANAWGARHMVDLRAPQNSNADHKEFPGKGAVAFYLWGINPLNPQPAMQWYERKAEQIKKAEEARFNPSQPRDENGRWASGGGVGGPVGGMSAEQTRDKIREEQRAYVNSLPQETRDNIEGYTGYEYHDINTTLRDPRASFPATAVESKEKALEKAADINKAINESPALKEDLTVYRGVNLTSQDKFLGVEFKQPNPVIESQFNQLVGTKFSDAGIISTSASEEVSEGFSNGIASVRMEIRVPAGKKALYVSGIGSREEEMEFLLPSKTKFRIVSVDPALRTIKAEVVS